jgi:aminopeptidase N
MKKIFSCIVIFICLAQQGYANYAKQLLRTKTQKYTSTNADTDIKNISLDLKFDWLKKQAYGSAIIELTALKPFNQISFDAVQMHIHSVKLVSGTALKYSYIAELPGQNLNIELGRTAKIGETFFVRIDYTTNWVNKTDPTSIGGSTGKGIRFFEPSRYEPNRHKQIWSMGEGEGNRYWFPCKDSPDDWRTTDFTATVDSKLTAISNGILIAKKTNADNTISYHYQMKTDYPNQKTAFIIGVYVEINQQAGKTVLTSFAYPEEKEATIATIERLPDMIRFFEDVTGQPYPYTNYAQVFVQELPWGAGSGSISILTENMVDDFATHTDYLYLWDMLEGEALANQWFGNAIGAANWSDCWLDKGFSRYFSCLYDEYKNGKEEFLLYQLTYDQGNYFADWYGGNRHPLVTTQFNNATDFLNENYPVSRGALVLHMLRKHLGEENWKKTIRLYAKENKGKTVTTKNLEEAVLKATGENLNWFFDQWVYKMGHPIFEVSKSYSTTTQKLTITVKQNQKKDSATTFPQVDFFKGYIDIAIDQKQHRVWINDVAENVFQFDSPSEPLLVNFDVESTWICETFFQKTTDELIYQLLNANDILARNAAMQELTTTAQSETATEAEKTKIKNAFCEIISGNSYWRLRFLAIGWYQTILLKEASYNPNQEILLSVIKNDSASWVRVAAISALGKTSNEKYTDLYISLLTDKSERVVNAAAIALGKTKSAKAYDALVKLKDKPSWKNQSLISSLYGMRELGGTKAAAFSLEYITASELAHWTLAVSVWDHRLAATENLARLKETKTAQEKLTACLKKALEDDNINDVFYLLLQITILSDPNGQQAFDLAKEKYKDNADCLKAVEAKESEYKEAIKSKQ